MDPDHGVYFDLHYSGTCGGQRSGSAVLAWASEDPGTCPMYSLMSDKQNNP